MELVINEIYVLSGWLFDDHALKSNDNKFVYVGSFELDGYPTAEFHGVNNGMSQWASHETLMEDEDVNCVVWQEEA